MTDISFCRDADRQDPLASLREQFELPNGLIYLDGNSLGPLPRAVKAAVSHCVEQEWGQDLIRSWNQHDWIGLPQSIGHKLGPVLGAAPHQVVCCDSVSVNLFKVLCAALALQPGRSKVLTQIDNFPTDIYMVEGLQQLMGESGCELVTVDASDIESALTDDIAVLMLTHVNFRSGAMHDMQRLTEAAHAAGILVIWDLSHSAGAVPLSLDIWQVDFAVGCGYKYLNGGPGAPAFIYAAERHHAAIQQPLSGWMGHIAPFAFSPEYRPAAGISRFLTGTPNILSMRALDSALDLFDGLSMQTLRDKSVALAQAFLDCWRRYPVLSELTLVSPEDPALRGSQLAFSHPHAYALVQAWIADGVIADFRAPDILRVGFTPLYLGYEDIFNAVQKLADIMASKRYLEERFQQRQLVT